MALDQRQKRLVAVVAIIAVLALAGGTTAAVLLMKGGTGTPSSSLGTDSNVSNGGSTVSGEITTSGLWEDVVETESPIIPNPVDVALHKNEPLTLGKTAEIISDLEDGKPAAAAREALEAAGLSVSEAQSPAGADTQLWLSVSADGTAADIAQELGATTEFPVTEEAYALAAGTREGKTVIAVIGTDPVGVYYGVQSLAMLLDGGQDGPTLYKTVIRDYPELPIRGVVTGYLNKSWPEEKWRDWLSYMARNKMNTYFSTDSDSYRIENWRDPYPEEELERVVQAYRLCQEYYVDYIYTIYPAQCSGRPKSSYIVYSSEEDYQKLMAKCRQVLEAGLKEVMVLFDDIDRGLTDERDKEKFGGGDAGFAKAQAYVMNRLYDDLFKDYPDRRLFVCYTDYSGLKMNPYLRAMKDTLNENILPIWTGDIFISTDFSRENIRKVRENFGRDFMLWINMPVNDVMPNTVNLGALCGAESGLSELGLCGAFSNPMSFSQQESSKLSVITIADYSWNSRKYDPDLSLKKACLQMSRKYAGELYIAAKTNSDNMYIISNENDVLEQLTAEFWEKFAAGENPDMTAIRAQFDDIYRAADVLLTQYDNFDFVESIRNALLKMRLLGEAGQLSVDMFRAEFAGSEAEAKALRASFEEKMSVIDQLPANVGTKVVLPYLEKCSNESRFELQRWYEATPISNVSAIKTHKLENIADNNSSTFMWCQSLIMKDRYVGLDLGEVKPIHTVVITMARDGALAEYMKEVTLEYSVDGENYIPIQKNMNQTKIRLTDLELSARYIRIRSEVPSPTYGLIISDFKVK